MPSVRPFTTSSGLLHPPVARSFPCRLAAWTVVRLTTDAAADDLGPETVHLAGMLEPLPALGAPRPPAPTAHVTPRLVALVDRAYGAVAVHPMENARAAVDFARRADLALSLLAVRAAVGRSNLRGAVRGALCATGRIYLVAHGSETVDPLRPVRACLARYAAAIGRREADLRIDRWSDLRERLAAHGAYRVADRKRPLVRAHYTSKRAD